MTRSALAGLASALVLAAGCGRSSAPDTSEVSAQPLPPVTSAVPADHLAPDELVEGKEQAFGIVLPRGLVVQERFVDVVHASGPMSVHALVKYFRPRLVGGSLREGEKSATFEHVTTAGLPPQTELTLHFEVWPGKTFADISATKLHSAPALDQPNDEARWKQEGLSPNGRILDPEHLH